MATISNDQVDIVQQLGTVSYAYAVAKHEVSVAQYLEFLNKTAHLGDPNTLYSKTGELNALNGHNVRTGRRITSDPYVYSAKPGRERLPANFLTWEDAARFVNWMANGQRSGGTDSGVYNMTEESPSRSAGAQVFLPSPDEWHKAAYYAPLTEVEGGPYFIPFYWRFPQQSDASPTQAIINPTT